MTSPLQSFREQFYEKFNISPNKENLPTPFIVAELRDFFESFLLSYGDEREKEVIGRIGAKLLTKHSPQIVLDAYFDAANEEMEKHNETNN